jgi:hypothetical protein
MEYSDLSCQNNIPTPGGDTKNTQKLEKFDSLKEY